MLLQRNLLFLSTHLLALQKIVLEHQHLDEDITKRAFWAKGVALCVKDVEEFLILTSEEVDTK